MVRRRIVSHGNRSFALAVLVALATATPLLAGGREDVEAFVRAGQPVAPGTYELAKPVRLFENQQLVAAPGLVLFVMADGMNNHAIEIRGSNVVVRGIEVFGNAANQVAKGHCIRASGDRSGIVIERNYLHDCPAYGIGFQAGNFRSTDILGNTIERTGRDCIDLKNDADDTGFSRISGNRVRGCGRDFPKQAGIDVRGSALVSDNFVRGIQPDDVGVRFRTGSDNSAIVNLYAEGRGLAVRVPDEVRNVKQANIVRVER